ncbi:MAG: hypothetical protein ACC652_11530 [Acidimicrobiales bacterium]
MNTPTLIEDHEQYSIELTEDRDTLTFSWKFVAGLSAEHFADGIVRFADQCNAHKPTRAAIVAMALDPDSPAMGWLRSAEKVDGREEYDPWWAREIVPVYHEAGIAGLGVATGDPNAPGEVETPPGVNFKMGYFNDLAAVLAWQLD